MVLSRFLKAVAVSCLAIQAAGMAMPLQERAGTKKNNGFTDLVEWDETSFFVRGERILLLSGEVHPFRLPVPDLWLDLLQKIKSLGFNAVSFYVDWNLLEGKQGTYSAEGIFDFKPFFEAATKAGVYLIARPGPYINAEVSGGGFPGWMQRFSGKMRTPAPDYMNATSGYIKNIGATVAEAQITNGGPVILLQPENEYTIGSPGTKFPDPDYMADVQKQYRDAGIIVPFINNDAGPAGYFTPTSGKGAMDIYGHDGYPLGFDCSKPTNWPDNNLPGDWHQKHLAQSPSTPYSIVEFQGGSFDPWGGVGFDKCGEFINADFARVFNKNDYSLGATLHSLYMIYGGTNWGNIGHPQGYTSYDYGAAIKEDRLVTREKYSELKLEGNFLKASPAYLTAVAQDATSDRYTDTSEITTTPLFSEKTSFWVTRHSRYNTLASTSYKLKLPTSAGTITIPQLNGSLSMNGRDSKIHVTDYDLGGINLLYSSAEIFTWKKYGDKRVLVVYGGPGELHEASFETKSKAEIIEGDGVTIDASKNGSVVLNWQTTSARKVVQLEKDLTVYILGKLTGRSERSMTDVDEDRNTAYDYWVLDLPSAEAGTYSATSAVIVKAGYLLRSASIEGGTLALIGDLNATTTFEVVGAPGDVTQLSFNGKDVATRAGTNDALVGDVAYNKPELQIPSLGGLAWKYGDSLPEIRPDYDDSKWTVADKTSTNMKGGQLSTPTTLFGGDYGYNTGNLLFRGHFVARGGETTLVLNTQGGAAYGASVWLNEAFLGSVAGNPALGNQTQTLELPDLNDGQEATITVLIDHMGLDENYNVGADALKEPRGILDYNLASREKSAVSWKLTGNVGGEDYLDRTRGPLNEGGLYAERQGWHLPSPPDQSFESGKPTEGLTGTGVRFYTTSFDLDLPKGYDIPLSFVFANSPKESNYRCQLYVNGYQFGKYVNNLGPQTSFPVPEGILNYHGKNYIALSLWALDEEGAKVGDLSLVAGPAIQTGYGSVGVVPMPKWESREGEY
ncbi:MAG: hypothetical protein M1832_000540 [Thelocarpon impressellum]|nr:MAG: hypothetical protein M1832_000540 [Thelocarpon impressellum]